ncbi:hypothetical protein RhiJN_27564 [Ceratobasidium sp. AG-Ba]|nr:hypothetical protein RhiJN_13508 [Ceratobasidium sp. AG-Ba]QRV99545.1 hypothetical protein RhiJN_27564 [Ceratobasidium sp. AG-Ba]QRW14067.1 hypothetical protein RhiLY_13066 [Ceratobasidium sp. AG-Ba]
MVPPLLSHPVSKIESLPSFSTFPSLAKRSFVIPSFAKDWPAVERWKSRAYLLECAGAGRVVPVERGGDYRKEDWGVDIMPWDSFLNRIGWGEHETTTDSEQLYLAQHSLFTQFPRLRADIFVPDYVYATPLPSPAYSGPPGNNDQLVINAWCGGQGANSPAHTEPPLPRFYLVTRHILLHFPYSHLLAMATRTINFYTNNLRQETELELHYHLRDVSIVLVFQPLSVGKLFKTQYPIVWKVITFRKGAHSKATVRYSSRLAFGYSQTDDDNMVDSAAWIEVQSGDVATLKNVDGGKQFTGVINREGSKQIVCKNSTNQRVNFSIGFVKGNDFDQRFDPALLWTGVGAGASISTQFTPVVSAYVTSGYRESQYLRGEVETDAIWTQDINLLDDVTSWYFKEDGESGEFLLQQANSV